MGDYKTFQKYPIYLWNTETLDWEASTKGSGTGEAVTVENFPALMTGSSIPILSDDPTLLYKLSDLDTVPEINQYFGYVTNSGAWYIMNLTHDTARYANGDSNYTGNWTNRESLSYDYFYNVF